MSTKQMDTDELSRLIFRRIVNHITPEETARLEAWREAHPANEETYRQLLDTTFLEREYRRMKAVDANRPLRDMQARIRQKRTVGLWWKMGAAAVVAGFVMWGALRWMSYVPTQESLPSEQVLYTNRIQPGVTKAVLTTDDGTEVQLGADVDRNRQVLQEAKKTPSKPKSQSEQKLNCLSTPRGGEFRITLEDGTQVWLNAESQLSYPDTFRTDERRVILKGEAYFQVAKNEEKPFYVESDGQLVRVYGTEFNIRSYQEDPEVYTTLVSGSVALQPSRAGFGELFLTPGYQAIFDKNDSSAYVRRVNTAVVTSWRQGMFVFEEQNLGQIMCTLSRWYDFDYEFTDNVLSETVFMGSVPRYGDFNDVLQILEKSGRLKFRINGRTVTVSVR